MGPGEPGRLAVNSLLPWLAPSVIPSQGSPFSPGGHVETMCKEGLGGAPLSPLSSRGKHRFPERPTRPCMSPKPHHSPAKPQSPHTGPAPCCPQCPQLRRPESPGSPGHFRAAAGPRFPGSHPPNPTAGLRTPPSRAGPKVTVHHPPCRPVPWVWPPRASELPDLQGTAPSTGLAGRVVTEGRSCCTCPGLPGGPCLWGGCRNWSPQAKAVPGKPPANPASLAMPPGGTWAVEEASWGTVWTGLGVEHLAGIGHQTRSLRSQTSFLEQSWLSIHKALMLCELEQASQHCCAWLMFYKTLSRGIIFRT